MDYVQKECEWILAISLERRFLILYQWWYKGSLDTIFGGGCNITGSVALTVNGQKNHNAEQ